jgi:hypothetical protein
LAKARAEAFKRDLNRDKSMSWMIALLSRTKKLPSYDSWMREKKEATEEELEKARELHKELVDGFNKRANR